MKKILAMAMAAAMVLSFAACSSKQDSSSEEVNEPTVATGTYTVYNTTGDKITELYLHEAGSEDKGENWAGEGLAADASVEVNVEVEKEAAIAGYNMTVEYVGEDGTSVVVFDSLHLEEANLFLKPAADVEGGATPFLAAE